MKLSDLIEDLTESLSCALHEVTKADLPNLSRGHLLRIQAGLELKRITDAKPKVTSQAVKGISTASSRKAIAR